MIDPRRPQGLRPRRTEPAAPGIHHRWVVIVDWLGAQKPLNLILGAVTIIAAVAALAHAV